MQAKQKDFKSAQTHYQFVLGPIKIKDGLFMGDALAAKDIEFIISNKVTHVINTVSKSLPNLWQRFGVQYLSVNWTQNQHNIFDKKNNAVNAIFSFVQQAMQQGQSCLIHSLHGKSRACAVMVAYLMKKYNWSLDKCFQYITSKKDHLQVRDNYLSQMQQLQKRMMQIHNLTNGWNDSKNQEELLLKNTYQNSKAIQYGPKQQTSTNLKRVVWSEQPASLTKLMNNSNIANSMSSTMSRLKDKKVNQVNKNYPKSILKGDKTEYDQKNKQQKFSTIDQKMSATQNFPMKKDNNFISAINGNIVHVTVNNFISTDKKPFINNTTQNKNLIMRPYSSDNKQRQQKQIKGQLKVEPKKNLFAYDNYGYAATTSKSPYDAKITSKLGGITPKPVIKKQIRNPTMMAYQRPQSANIAAQRRKVTNSMSKPIAQQILQKSQQMTIIGKKRYPSTNPREQLYKWK